MSDPEHPTLWIKERFSCDAAGTMKKIRDAISLAVQAFNDEANRTSATKRVGFGAEGPLDKHLRSAPFSIHCFPAGNRDLLSEKCVRVRLDANEDKILIERPTGPDLQIVPQWNSASSECEIVVYTEERSKSIHTVNSVTRMAIEEFFFG